MHLNFRNLLNNRFGLLWQGRRGAPPRHQTLRAMLDWSFNLLSDRERPVLPFYGFNRPGARPIEGVIDNWWRQGMMGGAKPHYDGIKAFSETDFTEDRRSIEVPTRVMQGDEDQIVPYKDAALPTAKLLKNGTLKIYPGYPHGMITTHADVINQDILSFIRA